jgi:hypothetical protein
MEKSTIKPRKTPPKPKARKGEDSVQEIVGHESIAAALYNRISTAYGQARIDGGLSDKIEFPSWPQKLARAKKDPREDQEVYAYRETAKWLASRGFSLSNNPHQPPASRGLAGCDGSQSDQPQQKDSK